jgi:hypothetical protein
MRTVNSLVIHHSACHVGSIERFAAEHEERGFGGIGYHAVVGNGKGMPDGLTCQGRPDAQKGCGVWGNNTGRLHVFLVGQFTPQCNSPAYAPPTSPQLRALGNWLLQKSRAYEVKHVNVFGHKEIARPGHSTLCPGNLPLGAIREWLYLWDTGQRPGPLDQFLARKSSGDKQVASQAAPGQTSVPVVRLHDGGLPIAQVKGKMIDGRLWTPTRDILDGFRRPMGWNPETQVATVDVALPPKKPP